MAQQTPAEATGRFGAGPSQQIGNVNIGPLFSPSFGEDPLLSDWGGERSCLAARGINLPADYLTEDFGNITDCRSRGFDYVGQVGLEVDPNLGGRSDFP